MKRVGTLWAPALGLGGGLGQAEGWERWRVGQDILLIVVVAWGSPHPLRRVFFFSFVPVKNGKGQLRADAAGRALSLPTAPALSPRPVGRPGSLPRPRSGPPCAWTPSEEATRSGSSLRLAEHPGFSHNSRPLGRAAPHRSAHAPAACVLASQTLDFFFFPCLPSFFMRWQIWVFFLVSFLSFSLPFSFPWLTREASGRGRLGEL